MIEVASLRMTSEGECLVVVSLDGLDCEFTAIRTAARVGKEIIYAVMFIDDVREEFERHGVSAHDAMECVMVLYSTLQRFFAGENVALPVRLCTPGR